MHNRGKYSRARDMVYNNIVTTLFRQPIPNTACTKLTTWNKECEHNVLTTCEQLVNRFVTTCLQTCDNLCVFTRVCACHM